MLRSSLGVSFLSVLGLLACSSDSPERVGSGLEPGGGGTGGQSSSAGAGGEASGGSNANAGSSSEGPPDLNIAGASGAGGGNGGGAGGSAEGSGGSAQVPDAAAPPSGSVCPPGPFADDPVPAGVAAVPVCGGMTFTEGAVWFAELGRLFFSDFQIGGAMNFGGRIRSFTPGGECEDFIPNAGTNGLAIAPDGNLLGCRHSDQTLTIFDLETQQPTVLIADNGGLSFNSPNDVAVRSDGNMYFTDPTYLLGGRMQEQPARAYRRAPSGALTVIDEGGNTNGITLSPDESLLYLAHLGGPNNIIVFDVDDSGAVSNQRPFANVGSDGMAIDCAGNLYITQGGGVQVFAPDGDNIGTIPAQGAANVAFGGPERRTLYITAQDELLAVELAIPGLPY